MMFYKNNRWQPRMGESREIIYIDQNYIEFGYFDITADCLPIVFEGTIKWLINKENCKLPLYWRNDCGAYTTDKGYENNIKRQSKLCWHYPIDKVYNFSKLKLKPPKYDVKEDIDFKTVSNFTIGVEYETQAGNIPWLTLRDLGLVPLYDGSINGHEYVTHPLTWKQLPIITQHLAALSKYTEFDKNCSLHIHFGNFPVTFNKIDNLVKCWKNFQFDLLRYIPSFSYRVEHYKDNGKAYNKPLLVDNLIEFYENTTGNEFENDDSFYWSNKFDEDEYRKWEVFGRYHNLNIMHLISGHKHKTVEFRFLHPTYNYVEIKWFIIIFGCFLQYIIDNDEVDIDLTVDKLISNLEQSLKSKMTYNSTILCHLSKFQTTCRDAFGINETVKEIYLRKFPLID